MPDDLSSSTPATTLTTPLTPGAVGQLYDMFYDSIYRYCMRRLYFCHVAEDAVSQIFLTVARQFRTFRGANLKDFRAWLYVIAANHVNQLIRQKFREQRLLNVLAQKLRQTEPGSRERRWSALYQSLLTLDEEQQNLLTLRFFQRLSHEEIGEIVGKRAGTVRVAIHRALKEIRPKLERAMDYDLVWEESDGH